MKIIYKENSKEKKEIVKIEPTKNRIITDQFVDYETQYLIIEESDGNDKYFSQVIDKESCEIIPREKWMSLFDGSENVITRVDLDIKLITRREINKYGNESIHEKLIRLSTGEVIHLSSSIGFTKDKKKNLLEKYMEDEKEKKKREEEYKAKTFDQKITYWYKSIYYSIRWQSESVGDPHHIFSSETYQLWKKQEPFIDLILDKVFEQMTESGGVFININKANQMLGRK